MAMSCPRLVIAGLSGDSGKTITSLSLLTALKRRGRSLSVFKKGPDYIDAAWLSWAGGAACRNLDTYMVEPDQVRASFSVSSQGSDIAIIEGNRGLFDGKDSHGTHSTASLAKLIGAPVVLVVNATKMTRTVAALVKGCQTLDADLKLAGVILNQIAGPRHRRVVTESIEQICDLPVLGSVPKLGDKSRLIPGRHLGLVTPAEYTGGSELEEQLAAIANQYLDVDRLEEIAHSAAPLDQVAPEKTDVLSGRARIGVVKDSVFTFYYPDNLEALEVSGAELVEVSSLDESSLPEIDGLYIGGGFPETHAERLSKNRAMLDSIKRAAEAGLPIYAECGGLILLCRSLTCDNRRFEMAGVFPIDLEMQPRPVGHGYTEVVVNQPNPFFQTGTVIRGHEFHYSGPIESLSDETGCMQVQTGVGLGNRRDGLVFKNSLACYTHIQAPGIPSWAPAMVSRAAAFRKARQGSGELGLDRCSTTRKQHHGKGSKEEEKGPEEPEGQQRLLG
jgi:cobyrinic acid a,c-diamide synthase